MKTAVLRLGLGALAAWTLPSAVAAHDISGSVSLKEKNGKLATDLSDVVVWVEGARAKAKPEKAALAMKGKTFTPHVLAIGVGSTVDFPNDDPILHNVFSVARDASFDLGLYKRPKSAQYTFQNPGVFSVYCNIHPQMSAIIVVRDNPYFTRAAKDGAFVIPDVPAGEYTVMAFHERGGVSVPQTVKLPLPPGTALSFALDASNYRRVQHKNKFGKAYGRDGYQ